MNCDVIISNESKSIQEKEIFEFLRKIDEEYIPPISTTVNLYNYTKKLVNKSNILTVRNHCNDLVGLCAFYCNDNVNKKAFISTIGMLNDYKGEGIGGELLTKTFIVCRKLSMRKVLLEVSLDNKTAFKFYKKNNFKVISRIEKNKNDLWGLMEIEL